MVKTINISLPKELLTAVDQAAKAFYASRSDYIRQALIEQLRVDSNEKRRSTKLRIKQNKIRPSRDDEYELDLTEAEWGRL